MTLAVLEQKKGETAKEQRRSAVISASIARKSRVSAVNETLAR
jgi:hypothetical protein